MASYKRKVEKVDAMQFLSSASLLPAGVSEVMHPSLGKVFVLTTGSSEFLRLKDTDWILTFPNGEKIAMSDSVFNSIYTKTVLGL